MKIKIAIAVLGFCLGLKSKFFNMPKAFLSHSSKEKWYVETVAEKLKKANIVYDAWTFEEGNRTIDEIFQGLNQSDIFVFFISDASLKSKWVQEEVNAAEAYLREGKIKKFFPILIDRDINHDDSRIPQWLREEYNLKLVSKPTKAAERIKQVLKILAWELYPIQKQLQQLFIGRTELIRKYEERIYDFDKPSPIIFIASGLPSTGRRRFITQCLKNSNKIREYYSPLSIYLGSRSSIEDFIISLYDFGISTIKREKLLNLMSKTVEEKVDIALEILWEIFKSGNIVYVIDNYAIISQDSTLVQWFKEIINELHSVDRILICLISRKKVRFNEIRDNDYVFAIDIPLLERYERNALFKAYLDIENMVLEKNDLEVISDLFNGYPEQISFAVSSIKHEGLPYLMDNLNIIVDFNSEKVSNVIRKYEGDNNAFQFLKFLSEFEFISVNLLVDIMVGKEEETRRYLSEFSDDFILDFIGAAREYLKLNDAIKDYIQRSGLELSQEYAAILEEHARKSFSDYETLDKDLSDYVISIKEAIKANLAVPKELLIPSHFLNAMRELYESKRKFRDVITLADKVLENQKFIDQRIVREVRYWLCLSLARNRNERLLKEVQLIDGPDHNFLLGFYYRLTGRLDKAIQQFLKVLDIIPNSTRVKRELVQCYLNTENYDAAFELAMENYELDKNNPYHIQSYFRCLIKTKDKVPGSIQTLQKLLKNLEANPHEKAREMYLNAYAQFTAFVEHNKNKSLEILDEAIILFPSNIYPPLTKLEICRKFNEFAAMIKEISRLERDFPQDSDIFSKLDYILAKITELKQNDKYRAALELIDHRVKNRFPDSVYDRIKKELVDGSTPASASL